MANRILPAAIILAACLAATAGAQAPVKVPALPDDVRPLRASGVGLNVTDIERSMKFYTEVFGFKVATRIPEQGPAQEYILGLTGNRLTDTLVVLNQATATNKPQPGAATFGRVILRVPNGRKMAERVAAAGYPPAKIVDGTNMVKDPDGYTVELYQPAVPSPATPAPAK